MRIASNRIGMSIKSHVNEARLVARVLETLSFVGAIALFVAGALIGIESSAFGLTIFVAAVIAAGLWLMLLQLAYLSLELLADAVVLLDKQGG
jgi:hypothetical protein